MVQKIKNLTSYSRWVNYTCAAAVAIGLSGCKVVVGPADSSDFNSSDSDDQAFHDRLREQEFQNQRVENARNDQKKKDSQHHSNDTHHHSDAPVHHANNDAHHDNNNHDNGRGGGHHASAKMRNSIHSAATEIGSLAFNKNSSAIGKAVLAESKDGNLRMTLISSAKKKMGTYSLKEVETNGFSTDQVKLAFCSGKDCAMDTESTNEWSLVVNKRGPVFMQNLNGTKNIPLDNESAEEVKAATQKVIQEINI